MTVWQAFSNKRLFKAAYLHFLAEILLFGLAGLEALL